jgi:hypothetical protein
MIYSNNTFDNKLRELDAQSLPDLSQVELHWQHLQGMLAPAGPAVNPSWKVIKAGALIAAVAITGSIIYFSHHKTVNVVPNNPPPVTIQDTVPAKAVARDTLHALPARPMHKKAAPKRHAKKSHVATRRKVASVSKKHAPPSRPVKKSSVAVPAHEPDTATRKVPLRHTRTTTATRKARVVSKPAVYVMDSLYLKPVKSTRVNDSIKVYYKRQAAADSSKIILAEDSSTSCLPCSPALLRAHLAKRTD